MSAHHTLSSRVGFEVELLAPRGATRADLAAAIARATTGRVERVFHADSEPSAVPGMGAFRHLTAGFEVRGEADEWVCSVVDDVTIVADLDIRAAPLPGWHRVVTDDPRLLTLLARVCDPAAALADVLDPVAELYGTEVTEGPGGVRKVADAEGASIAMAAPLPGERERPAEIVTAPIDHDHEAALRRLLQPARQLGFTVPVEAAVHLHLDAAPFRDPCAFANVVALFGHWREPLRRLFATNPACRRLAPPPQALLDLIPWLRSMDTWDDALAALADVRLTKYSDVNLSRVVKSPPVKDTLEVRILPGAIDSGAIMANAVLVAGLLDRCRAGIPFPSPTGATDADTAILARLGGGRW